MDLENALGVSDLLSLLNLNQRSLQCRDLPGLKRLVADLQALLGFDYAVLAQTKIPDVFDSPQASVEILDISYPAGYMDFYMKKKLYLSDATVCAFLSSLEPVHWQTVDQRFDELYPAARLSYYLGMRDGWTHGILNTGTMTCTELALGWPDDEKDPRTGQILAHVVPFLAEAFRRILDARGDCGVRLTAREIEVLNWLKEGKSSWEISMILRCSRRVVDFHVDNIKKKLNSTTRAQAIAMALHSSLIEF